MTQRGANTQQRILAFVATKPGKQITRTTTHENCVMWIAKRLGVPEKEVISEIEILEQSGKMRVSRLSSRKGNPITHLEVVRGVQPHEWAAAEFADSSDDDDEPAGAAAENLDYRQLADNLLLAVFELMGSSSATEKQASEIASLTEQNHMLRSELSLVKAERDSASSDKKEAQRMFRTAQEDLRAAQTQVAEYQSEVQRLEGRVTDLNRQVGDALTQSALFEGMDVQSRKSIASTLLGLIGEAKS